MSIVSPDFRGPRRNEMSIVSPDFKAVRCGWIPGAVQVEQETSEGSERGGGESC